MSSSNVSQIRGNFRERAARTLRKSPTTPVATSDYWSSVKSELAQQASDHLSEQNQRKGQQKPLLAMASDQDYYLDVAAASLQQQQQVMMPALQQRQLFSPVPEPTFQTEPDDYDDYAIPADESCCRLERSQVELVQLIGEGQKGYVFLGKLQSKDGQSIIDVAIKTLKFETEQLIERLMNEAAMMKQLEHPHIIKFIGMCPETPALIAMELAKFGEVKHYLRLNRHLIKCSQLVLFSFQISTALSYLESKNYVHRDVAARNVLVCSHNCVKLADFGLSRNLQPSAPLAASRRLGDHVRRQHDQQYQTDLHLQQDLYVGAPRVKLPVRWLAPESLVFRRFTSASDVWMFAVCVWELFQLGQARPWAHLRNNQVLAAIESGQRLARPEACPERLYQLMLESWSYAPVQRPKFREIKQCIWSIYLSERTREQLEFERLEQERQRRSMFVQQHHLQSAQVPLLATSNNKPHREQVAACDLVGANEQRANRSTNPSPSAGRLNHTPSSNYSSTLTTTDTEQMISPCSSAFNSMAREAAKREINRQQANVMRNSALTTQITRFEQRKSLAAGPNQRPHVLQKQRSQGAIGMSTGGNFESQRAAQSRSPDTTNSKVVARRSDQVEPLDDGALEWAKRDGRRAGRRGPSTRRLTPRANDHRLGLDEESESEVEESDEEDDGALWTRNHRFVSASPALTADANSQSRVVSIEPAYDGLDPVNNPTARAFLVRDDQIAMLRNNFHPSDGGRLSPGRGQLPASSPALTSSNSPTRPASWRCQPTTAAVDTNNNNNFAASHHRAPAQGQSCSAGRRPQPSPSIEMRVTPQPDPLSQMLQTLRITPMKAKLRSSPEQNVRVLQRQERRPTIDELDTPLERQQPTKRKSMMARDPEQQPGDGHTKQLMIHQRLLGRIRPSSSSASPSGDSSPVLKRDLAATSQQQRRPNSQIVQDKSDGELARAKNDINSRRPHQNKSVEAVDDSLQILESLMLGREVSDANYPNKLISSSSLPRRSRC